MPELPEVEATRRLLARHAGGKSIAQVAGGDDDKVFEASSAADVRRAFLGRRVDGARRLGKQFWLELSGEGATPVMHLGMTGQIWVKQKNGELDAIAYVRDVGNGKKGKEGEGGEKAGGGGGGGGGSGGSGSPDPPAADDAPWPPRFCKLELVLSDGSRVAFCDARRFARVRLVPAGADPTSAPPLSRLGFDPVLSMPPLARFRELLGRRRGGKLKALLLDQAFSAGVGNWVADEVLWQARLHPEQGVGALLDADEGAGGRGEGGEEEGGRGEQADGPVARLHRAIRAVCETACEVEADSARFPDDWLFTHRWTGGKSTTMPHGGGGGVKKEGGGGKGSKGGHHRIEFVTAGGRTSAYVPALQKMVGGGKAGGKAAGGGGGGGGRKPKKEETDEGDDDDGEGAREKAGGGGGGKKPKAAKASGKKQKKEAEPEAAEQATKKRPKRAAAAAAASRKQ